MVFKLRISVDNQCVIVALSRVHNHAAMVKPDLEFLLLPALACVKINYWCF